MIFHKLNNIKRDKELLIINILLLVRQETWIVGTFLHFTVICKKTVDSTAKAGKFP